MKIYVFIKICLMIFFYFLILFNVLKYRYLCVLAIFWVNIYDLFFCINIKQNIICFILVYSLLFDFFLIAFFAVFHYVIKPIINPFYNFELLSFMYFYKIIIPNSNS